MVKADFLHVLVSLNERKLDGVQIISAQQFPEWQGWKKGPTGIQGDDEPLPTVKYTTRGKSVRVVTVLYPGENCPIVSVEASKNVDDTQLALMLKDGTRLAYDEVSFRPEK